MTHRRVATFLPQLVQLHQLPVGDCWKNTIQLHILLISRGEQMLQRKWTIDQGNVVLSVSLAWAWAGCGQVRPPTQCFCSVSWACVSIALPPCVSVCLCVRDSWVVTQGDGCWQLQLFWGGLCCCTAGGPQGGTDTHRPWSNRRNFPHVIIGWLTPFLWGRQTKHKACAVKMFVKSLIFERLAVSGTVNNARRAGVVLRDCC